MDCSEFLKNGVELPSVEMSRFLIRAPVVLGAVALVGATTALWLYLGMDADRAQRRRDHCEDRGHQPEAHVGVLRPFFSLDREKKRLAEEADCRHLPDLLEPGTTNRRDTRAERVQREREGGRGIRVRDL